MRLLSGEKWPPDISPQEIADQAMAYRKKLNARIAEAKARTVKADPAKLRGLVTSADDPFAAAAFGYSVTQADEFLKMLRQSTDPRAPAMADYLTAVANSGVVNGGDLLEPLSRLCQFAGVDTALQFEYANLLLKAGQTQEALAVIKQVQEAGANTTIGDATKILRQRYLQEVTGLSFLDAETALGLWGPGPSIDHSAGTVFHQLLEQASALRRNGDDAAAASLAAIALSVGQMLESSKVVVIRRTGLMFEKQALERIPEEQQQSLLSVERNEWFQQIADQQAELSDLDKFYRCLLYTSPSPRDS